MPRLVKDNLNKWDELSPLKDEQIESILLLSQSSQAENAQINLEVDLNDKTNQSDEVTLSKPVTDVTEDINELLFNFDVNDIEDVRVEKYVNNLNNNSKKCNQINSSISSALNHLDVLLENYSQVSEKTKSLHVACEQLISDQVGFFFQNAPKKILFVNKCFI